MAGGSRRARRAARRGAASASTRSARSSGSVGAPRYCSAAARRSVTTRSGIARPRVERRCGRARSAPRPRRGRRPRSARRAPGPPPSGWPSAAAIRAAARSSAASDGSPGRTAVSWISRASATRPASSSRSISAGRGAARRSGGRAAKAAWTPAKLAASWKAGAAPRERQPEAVVAGAGASTASGPSGVHGAPLDRAREIDEEGAILDRRRGEGGEERLGLGAEAEADVEPREVAHRRRGSARRTRSTSWRPSSGDLRGQRQAVRPGARRRGARPRGRPPGAPPPSAAARASRLSRSKTVVAWT